MWAWKRNREASKKGCTRTQAQFVAYLDGRANPSERRVFEDHLAGCATCRARAEEFRGLCIALDGLPVADPSPAFDANLRARLAAESTPRGFWSSWVPAPRFAFAVMALLLMAFWVSSLPQSSRAPVFSAQAPASDSDFRMIRDLPVLENYDVLSKFDVLSELPGVSGALVDRNREDTE